jgi:hypothetical protein
MAQTTLKSVKAVTLQVITTRSVTTFYYTYIWDSSENARLLAPGERLSRPVTGLDIHRASLHHLLHTVIQYYISIHHTHVQDIDCLLTKLIVNSEFGDISCYVLHGTTGVCVPQTDSPVLLAQAQDKAQAEASRPAGINEPPPGIEDPDI